MKAKRLGAPDYANVEDQRRPTTGERTYAEGLSAKKPPDSPVSNYTKKSDKGSSATPFDVTKDEGVVASIDNALNRMAVNVSRKMNGPDIVAYDQSQPLPSRRAPKGNNPGSMAQMKFPRTSRSK